jgi:hypothetical protein
MQYVMLSDRFGGLNTYLSPDKVGPGGAQEMVGVDVSSGALTGVFGATKLDVPKTAKTITEFFGSAKYYGERYQVASFGGILYRSPRNVFPVYGAQYSSDGDTWDILTMLIPPSPTATDSGVSGGSNVAAGSYDYVITYQNSLGYESGPSPLVSVTVASNGSKVTIGSIPTSFATGTTAVGSTAITSVTPSPVGITTGTRLDSFGGIALDAYVVSKTSNTITMSEPAGSGAGAGTKIADAQIKKVNIYRRGGGTTQYLFAGSVNYGTTSFEDKKSNTELGSLLATEGFQPLPFGARNITISPSGTVMLVIPNNNIAYFSLVNTAGANPGLYNPQQTIKAPDEVLGSIYALDRFFFFTRTRNFSIFLDNALSGIPVLKFIEDSEPCRNSFYLYAAEHNSRVFWNTSNGIVSTDGNSIIPETKYVFSRKENEAFLICFGAISLNDTLYFYLPSEIDQSGNILSNRWIYKFERNYGWSKIIEIQKSATSTPTSYSEDGAIGYNGFVLTASYALSPTDSKLHLLESSPVRQSTGVYWTGEWTGDKHSSLKKFRKISALFTGSIEIEVYIDGVALPNKLSNDNQNKTTRFSWWLPPETKGRAISLKVELKNTANPAAVEELGVWVGEQRREMP